MIIRFASFDNDIVFNDEDINVLEIHNKKLFSNVVLSFNQAIIGEDCLEAFNLLEDFKDIKFANKAILLTDFFNVDFVSKAVLNKLNKKAISFLSDSEFYSKIEQDIETINSEIMHELFDLSPNISYNNLTIDSFIKLLNLKISIHCSSIINQLKGIVEIVSLLDLGKIIVCINLKTYLPNAELVEFYNFTKLHNLKLLLVESTKQSDMLQYENKLVIDEDLFELILK